MNVSGSIREWLALLRSSGALPGFRGLVLMISSAGYSIFSALSVSLLLPFVNLIFVAVPFPASMSEWTIEPEDRLPWLAGVCVTTWFLFLVKNLLHVLSGYLVSAVDTTLSETMRNRVMHHLSGLDVREFHRIRSAAVLEQLLEGAGQLAKKSATVLAGFARHGVLVVSYLTILFWLDPWLMAAGLLMAPAVSLAGYRAARRLRDLAERRAKATEDMIHRAHERLQMMKLIRILNGESFEQKRFEQKNKDVGGIQRRQDLAEYRGLAMAEIVGVTAGLLLLLWLGVRSIEGEFSHGPGGLVLFVAAVFSLVDPMRNLMKLRSELVECVDLNARLSSVTRTPPPLHGFTRQAAFSDKIEWHGVEFSYSDAGRPVLTGCHLQISRGDKVCLYGPSGIGKTTFVDLMLGLYPPSGGIITMDGIPIHTIALEDRSRLIGVMTQEPYLFHDTIRNNIVYNLPDVSDREIWNVLEHVQLLEWARHKKDGLSERISERGQDMSGGEKQRLALARILVRRPEILILDEATSALDGRTEERMLELLDRLFERQTVLFVSHRPSVLSWARRTLELRHGVIHETTPR